MKLQQTEQTSAATSDSETMQVYKDNELVYTVVKEPKEAVSLTLKFGHKLVAESPPFINASNMFSQKETRDRELITITSTAGPIAYHVPQEQVTM